MFNYHLRITAQYYENYAAFNEDYDGTQEGWKPKGGQEFLIVVDDEVRMFLTSEEVETIIKKLLADKSNHVVRYELVDYEFADDKPVDLTAEFNLELDKISQSS